MNQKREKYEHEILNDDSSEKKFEGSEKKVEDTEKEVEKTEKAKTKMKNRDSEDFLRPDYSDLYWSDAWLYFEME